MNAISCLYESVKPRLDGMTIDQFIVNFSGWSVLPVLFDGETIGAVLERDGEVHIGISPNYQRNKWLRKIIKDNLSMVIEKYGFAKTKVSSSHAIGHRLALLSGFKPISTDHGITEYICYKGTL